MKKIILLALFLTTIPIKPILTTEVLENIVNTFVVTEDAPMALTATRNLISLISGVIAAKSGRSNNNMFAIAPLTTLVLISAMGTESGVLPKCALLMWIGFLVEKYRQRQQNERLY